MRITNLLSAWHTSAKGRSAQPVNEVPFKEIMPLKLKERVSGKYDRTKVGGCLYEMTLVITCLQENAYENKLCQNHVNKFNDCYKKYLTDKRASEKAREKGVLVPGDKNLSNKQIRNLFKTRPLL